MKDRIPFNKPYFTGRETSHITQAVANGKISGDGAFTARCQQFFEERYSFGKCLLTTSCTDALEMAALLINIEPGDEVIVPSYTFVSTANAFALRGAKIIFADSCSDHPNIDADRIEGLITDKTKAIVIVHYAGMACEMDTIMELVEKHNLFLVEDAAQAIDSFYKGKALGSFGHFATFSFHETKNYTSAGEGGLLIINDKTLENRAEIIREKGTNRSQFFRGMIDKYSWVDLGSSYLMNDISAAYLWGNLEKSMDINYFRLNIWNKYYELLEHLEKKQLIDLPKIPQNCIHNAHMFYLKVKDLKTRSMLIEYLKQNNISSVFHYVPLHSAPAGKKFGRFEGADEFTTSESEKIIRLPMYYGLNLLSIKKICETIELFFKN